MMIDPSTYGEMYLKGKNAAQLVTEIRRWKREIGWLKNIAENPDDRCKVNPSEEVRISCIRKYIAVAKKALAEAGGTYTPSRAERKDEEVNANLPHLLRLELSIGGYFGGFETRTFTVCGDTVKGDITHSMIQKPSYLYDPDDEICKEDFLEGLIDLHIGEWRRCYDPRRFGYEVMDGTQWQLDLYFSNGYRHIKIHGSNSYPYNFDKLLALLNIDHWSVEEENDEDEK